MRVGSIGYATDQGIAHLMRDFWRNGVVDDVMVFRHGSRPTHLDWYPPDTIELIGRPFNGPAVDKFLDGIDMMLFFETPFDWTFPDLCRARGVKTAVVTMYEWFPKRPPHRFDLYFCPSLLDLDYFALDEPENGLARFETHPSVFGGVAAFAPVPIETKWGKPRMKALKFLHNAGNIGCRGHKGTLELMQAVEHVRSPFELTIRCQDSAGFAKLLQQMPGIKRDERVTLAVGNVEYGPALWDGFDVLVAPEKLNGLSLPLQEAAAAGMAVCTTDRYPANTWLPKRSLIPVESMHRASMGGTYLEFDECRVNPQQIAETIDRLYGTSIEEESAQGLEWAAAHSWARLGPQYRELLEGLV